jgi:hypothetical protein
MNYTNSSATTSGQIWNAWNITYASTSITSATTTATNIWTAWNDTYSITGATTASYTIAQTNQLIWTNWNQQLSAAEQIAVQNVRQGKAPSQEERDRWKRQEEERNRKYAEAEAERLAAKDRAEVLLLRHLTPEQKEDLRTKSFFTVEVDGIKYQIKRGSHGNVHMLGSKGETSKSFCIQPRDCPEGDAMLAQKLMLESSPEDFWKIANVTHHDGKSVPKANNVLEFRRIHKKKEAAA